MAAGGVWLLTAGVPVGAMIADLRDWTAWSEAFALFAREWSVSLGVAAVVAVLSILIATATVLLGCAAGRRTLVWMGAAPALTALTPPVLLGVGFIRLFNRAGPLGDLYDRTPLVWILALAARFSVITVLIAWAALGRRRNLLARHPRMFCAVCCCRYIGQCWLAQAWWC